MVNRWEDRRVMLYEWFLDEPRAAEPSGERIYMIRTNKDRLLTSEL